VKLTEFSLRNPLCVGLIAISLAIFGAYSYLTLSISIVPNITQASAIVSTTDPGADPATIETQITRPIEDAIATVRNVKTLTSSSSQGLSVVTVGFTTTVNADLVTIDVERAINTVRGTLPSTATQPAIGKLDTNSALPILKVVLSGPQPLNQIEAAAENQVQRTFQPERSGSRPTPSACRHTVWELTHCSTRCRPITCHSRPGRSWKPAVM
jgi:HAE1 family hydrophobic/amphiphilic exporter-1